MAYYKYIQRVLTRRVMRDVIHKIPPNHIIQEGNNVIRLGGPFEKIGEENESIGGGNQKVGSNIQ